MQMSPIIIYTFFFGSGFAALLYQIVWLKYLNLLFGSTTYATAAVVAAFMSGLSIGSRIAPRFSKLFSSSLKSYGLIEIGIGLFAITFPYLYSGFKIPFAWIFNIVGPQSFFYNLLTFLFAFLVLLIPTSFMGATLPILSHYLISDENVTRRSGTLYAMNTIGAVLGVLFSAFVLIPNLGLQATVHFGVLINTIIGVICYFTAASGSRVRGIERPRESPRAGGSMLWIYGASGLLAIGYEVLWTRLLVFHLGNSVYAYAIMLGVFLMGISLGSYLAGRWMSSKRFSSILIFSMIQIAWAFSILVQLVQFENLSAILVKLAEAFGGVTGTSQFIMLFLASLQLLLLPTLLSGALFPIVVTHLKQNGYSIQQSVALGYSYNTIGGILGAIVTGFVLLPLFGTQLSLILLASGNCILALLIVLPHRKTVLSRKYLPVFYSLFVLFLAGSILINKRVHVIQSAGLFRSDSYEALLHLEEDPTATITVETMKYMGESYRSLSVNGVNVAGTAPNLYSIQKMQAHLPIILFGPTRQKEILHIGFGSGGTAYSASLYPGSRITVVEISRGVVRNAHKYFSSVNHGVAESGKLQFIYFDGRSYLQNTTRTYDVILSDSIHPRYSGNGSLYTKDYYQLVYNRLNPGGVHSQWIPIYSVAQKNLKEILKAFFETFQESAVWYVNSTINPYVIVTGRKGAHKIEVQNFRDVFQVPEAGADLTGVSMTGELALLDHFLFGTTGLQNFTAGVEPHIDDTLTVEYESSRIINRQLSWWLNFRDLLQFREPISGYLSSSSVLNHVNYQRFYNASRMNLLGQLYFVGGNVEAAKRAFADAAEKNDADREPVEYYRKRF